MPPLSPILLLATSSARGEICGGPVSLLPMLVPDPSDCTAFFTCLAATSNEGGRRWAPVPGSCPPGTRFTGTHCEAMPRCQPPPPRGAAEGRRWCETPPFSFCSNWRHKEIQERKAGCCLGPGLPSSSDVNLMGSEKEHTGQIEDGQTAVGKPNTDEHMDTWNEPKSETEIAASSDSEPAPEPEAEPSKDDDKLEQATSEALLQKNVDNSISTVSSILNQSTAETELFEDTEEKGDNNLRPHRNLKNFKISVEMSEENKVVFKVPKEQVDITEEIRDVFKPLPGDDKVFLEINEKKTEADMSSLTVQSLQELEALVVQQVKNIVKRQNGTQ